MEKSATSNKWEDKKLAMAMQDPKVREVIYDNIRKEKIKLVHADSNEPVFRRETTLIGEKGDGAVNESHSELEDMNPGIEPEETKLQVDQWAYDEVTA